MILEIDMGNTRMKWRIRNQRTTVAHGALNIEESFGLLADEIEPYSNKIIAVFVACVVGQLLEQKFVNWSIGYLKLRPVFARSSAECGLVRNGYRKPDALGVDRWLGIVAAYQLTRSACIVISCGTATTVDLIAHNGLHIGGFIAPGLNLMLNSLALGTRQIKLDHTVLTLALSPATSTSDAIYAACAAMLTGLIDNGVRELHKIDHDNEFQMIFTGGDAGKLLPFYPQARLVPDLVLDGLACVLDYP